MTLAAEGALFGEPEPKFGSGIVALLLPWVTGPKQAKEMLLFGNDRVSAQRALEMGLVNRVVATDALRTELIATAGRCAMLDAQAVQARPRRRSIAVTRPWVLNSALREALDIDVTIETTESRGIAHIQADPCAARVSKPRLPGARRASSDARLTHDMTWRRTTLHCGRWGIRQDMVDENAAPMNRRALFRMIGAAAGSAVMYQAMSELGLCRRVRLQRSDRARG